MLTREYPPDVYGGAGVHVDFLVRELRELVDLDVHCMGASRATARSRTPSRTARLAGANPALQILVDRRRDGGRGAGDADLVHSHTWYANMAGHWAKLLYDIPHVVTAHSLEPQRPWKAEQLGGGYRLSSWAERTAYEAADAVVAVSHGMARDILASYPALDPRPDARHLQRHRHRLLPARSRTPTCSSGSASTSTGPTSPSSAGSPGRRACRTCCGPALAFDPRPADRAAGRRRRHPGAQGRDRRADRRAAGPSATASSWSARCCRARRSGRC